MRAIAMEESASASIRSVQFCALRLGLSLLITAIHDSVNKSSSSTRMNVVSMSLPASQRP